MARKNIVFLMSAAFIALIVGTAESADTKKGAKVFKKCKACHTIKIDGKNKIGPNLAGVVNREAGAVKGFKYSKALLDSNIIWDEKNLAAFLIKPKKFLKGTKMSFSGLKKKKDIVNIIAYLKNNPN